VRQFLKTSLDFRQVLAGYELASFFCERSADAVIKGCRCGGHDYDPEVRWAWEISYETRVFIRGAILTSRIRILKHNIAPAFAEATRITKAGAKRRARCSFSARRLADLRE
jgi:hypothetical protein